MKSVITLFTLTVVFATHGSGFAAGDEHDWNLGATGLRGWIRCDKMVTSDAREITITKVEEGSPAVGIFAVGDSIPGVGGKPFSFDPRTEMGKALTLAESEAGQGNLSLTRSRAGISTEVVVNVPVLGTYSATAPYDCPKSKRILEQGCKDLATRMAEPSYAERLDPIPRSLNALALLASGDSSFLPLIKKETEWAANYAADGMATWYYGYVMMFLAEYKIATGDDSVMPGLMRLALEAAHGQSAVGSWGHGFARPDGRLGGYGMMKILLSYGTHAKAVIPELTRIANYFEKDEKDFPPHLMRMKARNVRETITAIEASTDFPELIRLKQDKSPK